MTNIDYLIKKYYKPDGKNLTASNKRRKGEQTSNEYYQKEQLEAKRKHRQLILDELLTEIPFTLDNTQVSQIRYWIDRFNDEFKEFHRQSSNETIILAFIFIQQKKVNKRISVQHHRISSKYNLTNSKFQLIQNQLIFKLMQTTELTYNQAKHVNHEILTKQGF